MSPLTQQSFRFAPTAEDRFQAFHTKNPHVYDLFKQFTFQAINAGRGRFGARVIWERMRWYTRVETQEEDYKLNDHYPPKYARMFMADFPEHAGFFETREKR